MNKWINKNFIIRLIALYIALVAIGLAVLLFTKSHLGSDSITVLFEGLHVSFNLSYGQAAVVYNIVILFSAVIFARKYIGIGTVLYSSTIGVIIGFLEKVMSHIDFLYAPFMSKLFVMLLGHVLMGFGIALVIVADIGINSLDAIFLQINSKTNIKYQYLKIAADVLFCISGFAIGGTLGIGTIISALTLGLLIVMFKKLLEEKVFNKLQKM